MIQLTSPDSTALTLSLFQKSLITIREPWPLSIIVFRAENAERTSNQMNNKVLIISHHQINSVMRLYTTFHDQDNEGNEYVRLEHGL